MTGDPIGNAIDFIVALLLGSVGTAVAVIAVAGLGFAAMQGRVHLQDCSRVILGCFIVFGARQIAAGLLPSNPLSPSVAGGEVAVPIGPRPPAKVATGPAGNDPYAGASLVN